MQIGALQARQKGGMRVCLNPSKFEPDDMDDFEDEEGPWPIFPEVLAKALEVANARVDADKRGEDAVREVGSLALELYKDLLEDLGEYT